MQSDRTVSASGHRAPPPNGSASPARLVSLQAKCRQQAMVIKTLREAVSTFHRGATALKAENADLRAELGGLRQRRRPSAGAADRQADGALTEVVVTLDARAPGTARNLVVGCLEGQVEAPALADARLLVSELVTNSLRHGGAPIDEVVVSVELMPAWLRVGVQDSGSASVIAAQPPDLVRGGGFGLNLVQMLSERWGVERIAGGETQVWAQLARTPRASTNGKSRGVSSQRAISAA